METAVEEGVQIKQHVLERSYSDSRKHALKATLIRMNTAGVNNFTGRLMLQFTAPTRTDGFAGSAEIRKGIAISDLHRFEEAAVRVLNVVGNSRSIPIRSKRPYVEFSTAVFDGIRFGCGKAPDQERAYFLEAIENGEEIRVIIGDIDVVDDLRDFFTESESYQ